MKLDEFLNGSNFYDKIGLKSQEVAALLGISPQTLSSYSNDDIVKDDRLEKLYKALFFIGGDRYLMAANKIFYLAERMGITIDYSNTETRIDPYQLYNSKELWFFSDNPITLINQDIFFNSIFSNSAKSSYPKNIFSFFFRTIDGATRFAQFLERRAYSPLINNDNQTNGIGLIYSNYIYLIVSNIFPFGEDFVISNPGSVCAHYPGNATSFFYDGTSYVRSINHPTKIINEIRNLDIGTRYQPENFFPFGVRLTKELFFHDSPFTDPLVAKRSPHKSGGIVVKDGQLFSGYDDNDKRLNEEFSDKAGFIPIAILALKKIPGMSFSTHDNKISRAILDEMQKDHKNTDSSSKFW